VSWRTDFYAGIGEDEIEWLGSCKQFGYEAEVHISAAETESEYRSLVAEWLASDDAWWPSTPETGWGWTWGTSAESERVFTWYGDRIWSADLSSDHMLFRPASDPIRHTWTISILGNRWPDMGPKR
jgi:hypothetical protein